MKLKITFSRPYFVIESDEQFEAGRNIVGDESQTPSAPVGGAQSLLSDHRNGSHDGEDVAQTTSKREGKTVQRKTSILLMKGQ